MEFHFLFIQFTSCLQMGSISTTPGIPKNRKFLTQNDVIAIREKRCSIVEGKNRWMDDFQYVYRSACVSAVVVDTVHFTLFTFELWSVGEL